MEEDKKITVSLDSIILSYLLLQWILAAVDTTDHGIFSGTSLPLFVSLC